LLYKDNSKILNLFYEVTKKCTKIVNVLVLSTFICSMSYKYGFVMASQEVSLCFDVVSAIKELQGLMQ